MDGAASLAHGGNFIRIERSFCVISALGVEGRSGGSEKGSGAEVGKDADSIHTGQSGEDFGSVGFWVDRAVGTFEGADGVVTIETDKKKVPKIAGSLEVTNVAGV